MSTDVARPQDVDAEAIALGRELLAKHARSFSLAARALGPEALDEAAVCYALCRVADDAVDEAPSYAEGRAAIDALRDELHGRRTSRPLVRAWIRLALRRGIPMSAAWRLCDAIAGDAGPVRLRDDAELHHYSAGVAGTVGIMMVAVFGSRSPSARRAAERLGLAMQLTNIARDVAEDAARDRVYLPADRLRAAGVDPDDVAAGRADPARVFPVVRALVESAEAPYTEARAGLLELGLRSRAAGMLALHLYRAIGRAVVRRGPAALASRTRLGRPALAWTVVQALVDLAASFLVAPLPRPPLAAHPAR